MDIVPPEFAQIVIRIIIVKPTSIIVSMILSSKEIVRRHVRLPIVESCLYIHVLEYIEVILQNMK